MRASTAGMLSHLGALFLPLALIPSASGDCECGYSITDPFDEDQIYTFTDVLETDFTKMDEIKDNTDWVRQAFNVSAEDGRGEYGKMFRLSNTEVRSEGAEEDLDIPWSAVTELEMMVDNEIIDGRVPSAEIDSARLDIHWGSFRAGMRVTDENGTCAAFFWYFNDTQEIDMEFLSREFDPDEGYWPLSLVIQSKESKEAGYDASKTGTYQKVNLTFNPAEDFHEYRFDYLPGKVYFYVDSMKVAEMEGTEVPSVGGHLILQHWSNGNPLWSGGPPVDAAAVSVSYVKAYFNSSDPGEMQKKVDQCNHSGSAGAADKSVCAIPDGKQELAREGSHFFSGTDYITDGLEGSTGDSKPQTPQGERDNDDRDTTPHVEEQEELTDEISDSGDGAAHPGQGQPIAFVMALVAAMCLVQT